MRMGHPAAMIGLAHMHLYADCPVTKGATKGVALLQQAVDKQLPAAMLTLGMFYQRGRVVEQDLSKSIELHETCLCSQ